MVSTNLIPVGQLVAYIGLLRLVGQTKKQGKTERTGLITISFPFQIMFLWSTSLVLILLTLPTSENTINQRSYHFWRDFDKMSTRAPYKTITGGSCGKPPSCLIKDALSCVSEDHCVSFHSADHDLSLFNGTGGSYYKSTGGSYYSSSQESFTLSRRRPCESDKVYLTDIDICYAAYSTGLVWKDANVSCELYGGFLLVLDTDEKYYGFVQGFTNAGPFWVGARWVTDTMRWLSGKELPLTSPYWHDNQTEYSEDNFVALSYWSGRWALDDQYNYTPYSFICEF